jgi:hypothetical protein
MRVKKYEMIREIFNSCSGNQMRDVDISEIETDDPDTFVRQFLTGKNISCEKLVKDEKTIIFDISIDALKQRISFMEL